MNKVKSYLRDKLNIDANSTHYTHLKKSIIERLRDYFKNQDFKLLKLFAGAIYLDSLDYEQTVKQLFTMIGLDIIDSRKVNVKAFKNDGE